MVKYYNKEEKLKYVRGFKNSNLPLKDYCNKMMIDYEKMKIWLKEYKNPPAFGKINVKALTTDEPTIKGTTSSTLKPSTAIKFESETIKIELQAGYDKKLLQQMVEVLTQC